MVSAQLLSMATSSGLGEKMPPAPGQNSRAYTMLCALRAMVPRRAPSSPFSHLLALAAREFERPGNEHSGLRREWGVSATHRSRRRSGAGA